MIANKKIAVIGAGVSGLTSIKACKEENFDVVCYEIDEDVGGLWKYREENIPGVAAVSSSTVMNSNKETSAFSDFPPPSEFPIFMPHHFAQKYLRMYAEKFSLLPHIRFGRRVMLIKETEDFISTGRWRVTTQDGKGTEVEEDVFDAVMVCTGCYSKPKIPSIGQEAFNGNITHSLHYKDSSKFKGRRVLVIGGGNSSADVAVDLCGVAEEVYLNSKSGMWLTSRKGPRGEPWDSVFLSWINKIYFQYMPKFIAANRVENIYMQHFDGTIFNLGPKKGFFSTIPTVNDLLPFYLLNGSVKVRKGIKQFMANGVIFEEEENVTPIDDIIFCTGYDFDFPFLENSVHPSKLYKGIIAPDKRPTIGFIGFVEVVTQLAPLFEIQARWFVQVLRGNIELPTVGEMQNCISTIQNARTARYGEEREIICMESYLDELTQELGINPNIFYMLLSDPKLAITYMMGPLLPYQYRLQGPHCWSGARDAIISYRKRLYNIM